MASGFLSSIFPDDDFGLLAVILGMPLLGAFVNGIWGKRLGKPAVRFMAIGAVVISFLASGLLSMQVSLTAASGPSNPGNP